MLPRFSGLIYRVFVQTFNGKETHMEWARRMHDDIVRQCGVELSAMEICATVMERLKIPVN